ncbi:MAG: hypothetical protein KF857_09865 [Fimbriimonadaceae bacterium]|nr:hypothetical protein [Fimbriimonadaceae bacterium]
MYQPKYHRRRQKAAVFVGFVLLSVIIFMCQLWLFVMVLENLLAGRNHMVVQASALTIGLLAVNVWMLAGVNRLLKMN